MWVSLQGGIGCVILNVSIHAEEKMMPKDLESLQRERARLLLDIAELGDFRRGSISETYRRCGKARCCCAAPDHPGHGPQYLLMTKVEGRSHAKYLRPGAELIRLQAEVKTHLRFREMVQRIVEISEEICDKRPAAQADEGADQVALKKTSHRSSRKKPRGR